MSSGWLIAAIPATLALMAALLALSGFVEQHFLSPRSLILGAVRARHNTPEYTEAFVIRQLDLLLPPSQANVARRSPTIGAPSDRQPD